MAFRLVADGILFLLLFGLISTSIGCPPGVAHQIAETTRPRAVDSKTPQTKEKHLERAEKLGVEGSNQKELEAALESFEHVEKLDGADLELTIKQLRVVFLIASPIQEKRSRVANWIKRGQELAKRVIRAAPDRVEGHYYEAVFLGFEAQNHKLRALDILPCIVEAGQRAIEIDETFDDAAGLVLMGSVMIRAPAWPHGIGDPEEGLELLKQAVKTSDYPVNRIILAKAFLDEEMIVEACELLDSVLLSPKVGRWAKTWHRHRPEAWALWNSYRCYR